MNLLFRLVRAAHASGTHHKLALDALPRLSIEAAEPWRRLILKHHEEYLLGAKAPDKKFKDFRNHVLHVADGYWGGAVGAAEKWFVRGVEALRKRDWAGGAYALGVLSHYITDPIMPLHTAQSAAENTVHRALEWSVACSYDELIEVAARRSSRFSLELSESKDWLPRLMHRAAEVAHRWYQPAVRRYSFDIGVQDPPEGLDAGMRQVFGELLIYAQSAYAKVLDRAFLVSGVRPPEVMLAPDTFLVGLSIPLRWVTRNLENAAEQRLVEAMYDELRLTGRVEKTLTDDVRSVREAVRSRRKDLIARNAKERRPTPSTTAEAKRSGAVAKASSRTPFHSQRRERDEGEGIEESKTKPTVGQELLRKGNDAGPLLPRKREVTQAAPKAFGAPIPPATTVRSAVRDSSVTAPNKDLRIYDSGQQSLHKSEHTRSQTFRGSAKSKHEVGDAGSHVAEAESNTPSQERAPRGKRFRLKLDDKIEDAPGIGKKTGRRFRVLRASTVADLLKLDAEEASRKIAMNWITPQVIRDWQDQSRLMCEIPELKVSDAQWLTACGCRTRKTIAAANADAIYQEIRQLTRTSVGKQILRGGKLPKPDAVREWISNASVRRNMAA